MAIPRLSSALPCPEALQLAVARRVEAESAR
mgnify:CR=1 FL=1